MFSRPATSVLFLLIILLTSNVYGETHVSGPQYGTWTLANSPYILNRDVSVPDGNSLTILSEVEVRDNSIVVEGSLEASDVVFHHVEIHVEPNATANLSACTMKNSFVAYRNGSEGQIKDCVKSEDVHEVFWIVLGSDSVSVVDNVLNYADLRTKNSKEVRGNSFDRVNPIIIDDPKHLSGLSGFSGNTYDHKDAAVRIHGTLSEAGVMDIYDGLNRYVIEGGQMVISREGSLTIMPEVEVRENSIVVEGSLEASDVVFHHVEIHVEPDAQIGFRSCTLEDTLLACARDTQGMIQYSRLSSTVINDKADVLVRYNDLSNGHVYSAGDPDSEVVIARNWWGTTDPTEIQERITDDPGRPRAEAYPWLLGPYGPIAGKGDAPAMEPPSLVQYDSNEGQWQKPFNIPETGNLIVLNHGWNDEPNAVGIKNLAVAIGENIPDVTIVGWDWGDGPNTVSDANPNGRSTLMDYAPLLGCIASRLLCVLGAADVAMEVQRTNTNAIRHGTYLGQALKKYGITPKTHGIHMIGHSFGGVVSAEAARVLSGNGKWPIKQLTTIETPAMIFPYAIDAVDPTCAERVEVIYYDSSEYFYLIAAGGPLLGTGANNVLNAELNPFHYGLIPPMHGKIMDWYAKSVTQLSCDGERYGFGWSFIFHSASPDWPMDQPTGFLLELPPPAERGCFIAHPPSVQNLLVKGVDLIVDGFETAFEWFGDNADFSFDQGPAGTTRTYIRMEDMPETTVFSTAAMEPNDGNSPAYEPVACLFKTLEVPAKADHVAFDVRFDAVGEDDLLTLSIDDEILLMVDPASQEVTEEFVEASAYVGHYAGKRVTLRITLRGNDGAESVVDIDNLRFTALVSVDFADYADLAGCWHTEGLADCKACDFDGNDRIDANDLASFADVWLK